MTKMKNRSRPAQHRSQIKTKIEAGFFRISNFMIIINLSFEMQG